MRLVVVAAALLLDGSGRVLLAQRPEGKSLAGLWEFPGGKLEPNERAEDALARELHEELGIRVEPQDMAPLTFASHSYDSFHILMPLWAIKKWQGEPSGVEGQHLEWVSVEDLRAFPMPEADVPLVSYIERHKASGGL
jgi:8-oxo-dGTP diphosphatase